MRYELHIEIRPGLMLMVESHGDHRVFTGCRHSDRPGGAREQDLLYLSAFYVHGG